MASTRHATDPSAEIDTLSVRTAPLQMQSQRWPPELDGQGASESLLQCEQQWQPPVDTRVASAIVIRPMQSKGQITRLLSIPRTSKN
ncbi:MAG TPA: hypothetical protein VM165_05400 [Planctomycetaceae bacterium]|nr:hypothetical protein [Planctomycetaceae bacterium]